MSSSSLTGTVIRGNLPSAAEITGLVIRQRGYRHFMHASPSTIPYLSDAYPLNYTALKVKTPNNLLYS